MTTHTLDLKWSTSQARDTMGWNIASLVTRDRPPRRFRTIGGGYDMAATVFADWLQATYPDRLTALADQAYYRWSRETGIVVNTNGLYGMTHNTDADRVTLDGGCGDASIERIARRIGLEVRHTVNAAGHQTGWTVTDTKED